MLSNCSLRHKLQQSHGDLQSLSMSSESFNPGQTQQAHQQERVSAKKAKHVTMERVRQRQREILQLLLASGGGDAGIYLFCSVTSISTATVDVFN